MARSTGHHREGGALDRTTLVVGRQTMQSVISRGEQTRPFTPPSLGAWGFIAGVEVCRRLAVVVMFSVMGAVVAQAENVFAGRSFDVLLVDHGAPVAWWYPDERLVLALGIAAYAEGGVPMARRRAVVDAQRTLVRAVARLQGRSDGRVAGVIRGGRVVLEEAEGSDVRVYLVARYWNVELTP